MQLDIEAITKSRVGPLAPFGAILRAPADGFDLRRIGVGPLRDLVNRHRLLVLRGFRPFEKNAFEDYCSSWGGLLRWNFGAVLELVEQPEPKNYIFASGNVPFHWDGAFADAVPNFQFFQCNRAAPGDAGGETLFCDTVRVYDSAPEELRALWAVLQVTYVTEKVAHYGGRITCPVLATHPVLGVTTLRFNEPPDEDTPRLNVPEVLVEGLGAMPPSRFFAIMRELLHDARHSYAHPWRDGDMLVADNHALLHGRRAFRPGAPRHLYRVHIL
jgi:alpha-ketoglutarate-dependent taurine dioxygenase